MQRILLWRFGSLNTIEAARAVSARCIRSTCFITQRRRRRRETLSSNEPHTSKRSGSKRTSVYAPSADKSIVSRKVTTTTYGGNGAPNNGLQLTCETHAPERWDPRGIVG